MSTPLTRRSMFGFAAALSCPLCPRAFAADAPHWGYEGATGPEHWGDLEADFRTCEIGTQQSPINLTGAVKASLRPVGIDYQKVPLRVWNNGRYIQINVPPGSQVNLAGVSYQLLQFHFHHPSEHLLDGERFDMEAHFVNKSADGSLCALGVFIKRGLANPVSSRSWRRCRPSRGRILRLAASSSTQGTSADLSYFEYEGSLTTPPCPETVNWVVFRTPIEASPEQIERYAAVFPMDARPIQPLDRRFVLEGGS